MTKSRVRPEFTDPGPARHPSNAISGGASGAQSKARTSSTEIAAIRMTLWTIYRARSAPRNIHQNDRPNEAHKMLVPNNAANVANRGKGRNAAANEHTETENA